MVQTLGSWWQAKGSVLVVGPGVMMVMIGDVSAPVRIADTPFSSSTVTLIIAGIFISAGANAIFNITTSTVRQIATPQRLLPSVMAVNYTLATVTVAIGTLGGGFLGSKQGPAVGLVVGCAITVGAGLVSLGGRFRSVQNTQNTQNTFFENFMAVYERTQMSSSGIARLRERTSDRGLLTRIAANAPAERCQVPECAGKDVDRCAYVDHEGHACPTSWCGAHSAVISGHRVCPRHSSLLKGLGLKLGERDQLPGIDNLSPSIAIWAGQVLDPGIRMRLSAQYPKSAGYVIIQDRVARFEGPAGPEWRSRWRVLRKDGTILTTTVVVTEDLSPPHAGQ